MESEDIILNLYCDNCGKDTRVSLNRIICSHSISNQGYVNCPFCCGEMSFSKFKPLLDLFG